MGRRTKIGPDGSVIKDGDEGGSSSSSGGSAGGRRRWCRLPTHVDTFGFHLQLKHFSIVLLLISLTMGSIGLGLFLLCLAVYSRAGSGGGSGGGGSGRWKDGKAVGSNIKGVGDLPKAPKGG